MLPLGLQARVTPSVVHTVITTGTSSVAEARPRRRCRSYELSPKWPLGGDPLPGGNLNFSLASTQGWTGGYNSSGEYWWLIMVTVIVIIRYGGFLRHLEPQKCMVYYQTWWMTWMICGYPNFLKPPYILTPLLISIIVMETNVDQRVSNIRLIIQPLFGRGCVSFLGCIATLHQHYLL